MTLTAIFTVSRAVDSARCFVMHKGVACGTQSMWHAEMGVRWLSLMHNTCVCASLQAYKSTGKDTLQTKGTRANNRHEAGLARYLSALDCCLG